MLLSFTQMVLQLSERCEGMRIVWLHRCVIIATYSDLTAHRPSTVKTVVYAQAAALKSPQALAELDRILVSGRCLYVAQVLHGTSAVFYCVALQQCSSDPDAETKALQAIQQLKDEGEVKGYGGAQQVQSLC